jgi:hypothetical protein
VLPLVAGLFVLVEALGDTGVIAALIRQVLGAIAQFVEPRPELLPEFAVDRAAMPAWLCPHILMKAITHPTICSGTLKIAFECFVVDAIVDASDFALDCGKAVVELLD